MPSRFVILVFVFAYGAWFVAGTFRATAQDAPVEGSAADDAALADRLADEALADGAQPATEDKPAEGEAAGGGDVRHSENVLDLVFKGGLLMIPILIMSIIVVAFGIERAIGLQRSKVIPPELVNALGNVAPQQGGFDPRKAYRICQQYPSAASNVIRAMLLKVGRPHSEVEHAVAEANEREAARLYGNVRTLNLAAAITPLMGLLGTVWGMIQAFIATANLPLGANKSTELAKGIYVALVTTAGGLAVAIPAAVLAHIFEGRIQKLFLEIDELLFSLLPQVERFEGKLRVSRQQYGEESRAAIIEPDEQEPVGAK